MVPILDLVCVTRTTIKEEPTVLCTVIELAPTLTLGEAKKCRVIPCSERFERFEDAPQSCRSSYSPSEKR